MSRRCESARHRGVGSAAGAEADIEADDAAAPPPPDLLQDSQDARPRRQRLQAPCLALQGEARFLLRLETMQTAAGRSEGNGYSLANLLLAQLRAPGAGSLIEEAVHDLERQLVSLERRHDVSAGDA